MARDEVDTSLITSEPRKRKLPSYATNNDNISADKEEIIKRMKHTNYHACKQSTALKFDYYPCLTNIFKHPIISLIPLKKMKDLQQK